MRLLLNALPKSGTHATQKLLTLLGIPFSRRSLTPTSGWGQNWADGFVKFLLRHPYRHWDQPIIIGLGNPSVVGIRWLRAYLSGAKGYVSGHVAFSEPFSWLLKELNYKIILTIRHPGAVVYSWARYIEDPGYPWKGAKKDLVNLSVEERFEAILQGKDLGGIYHPPFHEILSRFVGWLDLAEKEKYVYVVRFEDLVGPPGGGDDYSQRETIKAVAQFVGVEITTDEVRGIQKSLFGGTSTFREGKIDAWRSAIPSSLQHKLFAKIQEKGLSHYLKRLGYD